MKKLFFHLAYFPFHLFIFSPFNLFSQDSTILWTPEVRLEWTDFLGKVPEIHEASAMTDVTIEIALHTEGNQLIVRIVPVFNRYHSWSKQNERNPELLKHEQVHFDINELNARRLRAAIKQKKLTMNNISKVVNVLIQEHTENNRKEQDRYDRETDHSQKKEKQQEWNDYVARELKRLDAHKSGKLKLRVDN